METARCSFARRWLAAVLVAAPALPSAVGAQQPLVPARDERLSFAVSAPTGADTAGRLFQPGSRSAHVRSGLRTGAAIGAAVGAVVGVLVIPHAMCGGGSTPREPCSAGTKLSLLGWLTAESAIGFGSWGGIIGALRPVQRSP